jgi:starch synthase
VDGIPEVVDDGRTGLLVPPDDPAALADAIVRLLRDNTLAQACAEAGRQRVETLFSAAQMALHYNRLYAQLLDR